MRLQFYRIISEESKGAIFNSFQSRLELFLYIKERLKPDEKIWGKIKPNSEIICKTDETLALTIKLLGKLTYPNVLA